MAPETTLQPTDVDIVIPCLNEARNLVNTLPALVERIRTTPLIRPHLLLVDNGSEDSSKEVARLLKVDVTERENCTIAAVRNWGASQLKSPYISFLDADVEITDEWLEALLDFVRITPPDKMIVTGAPCNYPPNHSWIETHWFSFEALHSQKYVNSANLITTRRLFDCIGGFDERLRTGEDCDFCLRARKAGAQVRVQTKFKCYHHGYPRTLGQFFRRELWHGIGDVTSLGHLARSKPAMLGIVLFSLLLVWLLLCLAEPRMLSLFAYPFFLAFILFAIAWRRSDSFAKIPGNMLLGLLYLSARLLSLPFSFLTPIRWRSQR